MTKKTLKSGQHIDHLISTFTRDELEFAYYHQVSLRCAENQKDIIKMLINDLKVANRALKHK